MAQAKMAAALQDGGRAASLLVAAPVGSQHTVSATGHAGAGGLGVAKANRDADRGFARDHGTVGEHLVDEDLADSVIDHGTDDLFAHDTADPIFTRNADAPNSGAGGLARGHGVVGEVLVDMDPAGVVGHGADDFFVHDTAAPFAGMDKDLGEPLLDKDRAGELAYFLARDTDEPFAGVVALKHGVTFGNPLAMAAAGEAHSYPISGQVSIDVVVMDGKAGVPTSAKAAAGGTGADARGAGGNLDSAVVGIVSASTAITMFAAGAVSPPLAFGLFVLLLGGLSLLVSAVRGA